MFLGLEKKSDNFILAKDSCGDKLDLKGLKSDIDNCANLIKERSIAFILCENTVGSLEAYLISIEVDIVPVMLSAKINKESLDDLIITYKPYYLWVPEKFEIDEENKQIYSSHNYVLYRTGNDPYQINDKLEVLMTTSGSTGNPKLVRYKKGNLEVNAKNVALAFGWTSEERPLCDLPMNYTMGLNVINTHLFVGSTVYLTLDNIMSGEYWDFIKDNAITNITGVPFTYDIFSKLRVERMPLPNLHTISQGGGKLSDDAFRHWAEYANSNGKRFIASFGTTETAARMAMLDPNEALTRIGSIGKAIPEGELFLMDEAGNEIQDIEAEGELAYKGPNVTMGYAVCIDDLNKDDEFNGIYYTGDMARRDKEGFYYIIGRKSRFLKMIGYRVNLDDCERKIKNRFGIDCACTGSDDAMKVFITDEGKKVEVSKYLEGLTNLYKSMFKVSYIETIPRNDSGKVLYSVLQK